MVNGNFRLVLLRPPMEFTGTVGNHCCYGVNFVTCVYSILLVSLVGLYSNTSPCVVRHTELSTHMCECILMISKPTAPTSDQNRGAAVDIIRQPWRTFDWGGRFKRHVPENCHFPRSNFNSRPAFGTWGIKKIALGLLKTSRSMISIAMVSAMHHASDVWWDIWRNGLMRIPSFRGPNVRSSAKAHSRWTRRYARVSRVCGPHTIFRPFSSSPSFGVPLI